MRNGTGNQFFPRERYTIISGDIGTTMLGKNSEITFYFNPVSSPKSLCHTSQSLVINGVYIMEAKRVVEH